MHVCPRARLCTRWAEGSKSRKEAMLNGHEEHTGVLSIIGGVVPCQCNLEADYAE